MDFQQLLAKLGRTGQAQAGGGLLAIILSFFAFATVSVPPEEAALLRSLGDSTSGSQNAWGGYPGFWAWFPCLMLLALGALAVTTALGITKVPMAITGVLVAGLAAVILLLNWLSYDSGVGAGWSLYIVLLLAIAVAVVSYMGMAAEGSSFGELGKKVQSLGGNQQPPAPPQA